MYIFYKFKYIAAKKCCVVEIEYETKMGDLDLEIVVKEGVFTKGNWEGYLKAETVEITLTQEAIEQDLQRASKYLNTMMKAESNRLLSEDLGRRALRVTGVIGTNPSIHGKTRFLGGRNQGWVVQSYQLTSSGTLIIERD